MNYIRKTGLITLVCFVSVAAAQDWYHNREERFRGEQWRGHLFAEVREDLDHIGSAVFAAGRERRRLDKTKQELTDLQAKLEQHRFDRDELNDVIDSMTKSADDQRLSPRDRQILFDDNNRLKDYREHHEHWNR